MKNAERVITPQPQAALAERSDSELGRVYHAVLNAIMDRVLLPGRKLTESDLCRQMVCSRNTVRGALSLLAHDKIVDLLPNRGAFVHVPDLKEIRDVFEMRIVLAEMAVAMLAQLPDLAEKLKPLDALVAQYETLAVDDRVGRERMSNAFHIGLVRLTGNRVLEDMVASLCARSSLMVALTTGRQQKAVSEDVDYGEILALLREGRYKRAVKKIRKYLSAGLACLEMRFEDGD